VQLGLLSRQVVVRSDVPYDAPAPRLGQRHLRCCLSARLPSAALTSSLTLLARAG